METSYVEPSYKLDKFNCPYCNTYLHQTWFRVMHDPIGDEHSLPSYNTDSCPQTDAEMGGLLRSMKNSCEPEAHITSRSDYVLFVKNTAFSKCTNCGKYAIWIRNELVYPVVEHNSSWINDEKSEFKELVKS